METALTTKTLLRWRVALVTVFFLSGLSIATWASRVPALRLALDIDTFQVGMLLLGAGTASIVGLSIGTVLIARVGARIGLRIAIMVFGAGVLVIGIGTDIFGLFAVVLLGLALFGFGNGAADVMMNVEGAAIEKSVNKTLLPMFHAFFSVGTVAGAGLGALAISLGVDVFTHAWIVAVAIVVIGLVATANIPRREITLDPEAGVARVPWRERLRISLQAWREPRTYTLGIVMLGMAFAEGGANDWMALAVVDGHGGSEAIGALGLAVFSIAMTGFRLLGGPLVDRFGRVATLRVLSVLAASGLLLFIFAPNIPLLLCGAALWGAGVSLGFPLGMSAAADDPAKAAARVSAAATIGYIAFLCGPPLLGFLSHQIGVLNSLLVLVGLIIASGLASGSAKPLVPAGADVADDEPAAPTDAKA